MTNTEIAAASKVMLGTTEAVAMYIGSTLMWSVGSGEQPHDYSLDYFTIESLEDSNVIKIGKSGTPPDLSLSYSTDDGVTWTDLTITAGINFATINTGDKIIFKGTNDKIASAWNNYYRFNASKNFKVYGNAMSLLWGDNFTSNSEFKSGTTHNLCGLFNGTTTLIDASNLILPALTCTGNCYNGTFRGCKNLTVAPKLPATLSAFSCYGSMFEENINLEVAPEINLINMSQESCMRMFTMSRNTKLTTPKMTKSPILRCTTGAKDCYREMFKGNGNLTEITCFLTSNQSSCCNNWIANACASSGTFYKAPSATWSSYVPSGWAVADYEARYVLNGLIFHLDGINKGAGADWVDLVGNKNFTIYGTGITSLSNSYYFDKTDPSYFKWSGTPFNESEYTVEVCMYPSENTYYVFGGGQRNSGHPIFYYNGSVTWGLDIKVFRNVGLTSGSKYTVSVNNDRLMKNGVEFTTTLGTDFWDVVDEQRIQIGKGSTGGAANNPFGGYLYSIRIYNRKLTREEQLQNMTTDNIRFNLGL